MKKKALVVITIVVCVLAVIAALFGYRMMQQKEQVRDLLELGNQYLEEEQYDEAIVAYKQLLAIEPKEETARENIVVAAVEWSDDLIEIHEYNQAEGVIMDVYSIVPDIRLETKRLEIIDKRELYEKELLEIKKQEEERKQAIEQIIVDLSELARICADGDDDAVFSYLGSDVFQKLIQSEHIEYDKKYETEYGALGLYEEGKYLYFGDYNGNVRSGNGAWYVTSTSDSTKNVARGSWSNDKPNGKQSVYHLSNSNHSVTGLITVNVTGNVIDGLWDGVVEISQDYGMLVDNARGPSYNLFSANYHSGIGEVIKILNNGVIIIGIDQSSGVMYGRKDNTVPAGILGFAETST